MERAIAITKDIALITQLTALAGAAWLALAPPGAFAASADAQSNGGDVGVMRRVLGALLGPNPSHLKVKRAKTDLHALENCLYLYKIDKGRYPSTEEGLTAVVGAGKCKPVRDPWGREYVYLFPGDSSPDSFHLKTYGADGRPGGEGEDADIGDE